MIELTSDLVVTKRSYGLHAWDVLVEDLTRETIGVSDAVLCNVLGR